MIFRFALFSLWRVREYVHGTIRARQRRDISVLSMYEKRGVCSQGYLREDILVFQLKERLQTISLCEKYADWMLAKIDEWVREETAVSQSDVQNLSAKIKTGEERMEKLVSAYLDGDIPKQVTFRVRTKSCALSPH